jgi:DNA-binding transcriptional MerR regulator
VDAPERGKTDKLIQPCEASEITGLSARSLRRYNSLGLLGANKTPGGHRRYWLSEVRLLSRPAEDAA